MIFSHRWVGKLSGSENVLDQLTRVRLLGHTEHSRFREIARLDIVGKGQNPPTGLWGWSGLFPTSEVKPLIDNDT